MTAGWILIGIGGTLSVAILGRDFLRVRALSGGEYGVFGLWAPEVHVPLALLTGAGSWMAWGWIAGISVLACHAVVGIALAILMRR